MEIKKVNETDDFYKKVCNDTSNFCILQPNVLQINDDDKKDQFVVRIKAISEFGAGLWSNQSEPFMLAISSAIVTSRFSILAISVTIITCTLLAAFVIFVLRSGKQ